LHANCTAIFHEPALALAAEITGWHCYVASCCDDIRQDAILDGPAPEVTVTTDRANDLPVPSGRGTESLDEQARRKGIHPIQSADDLAQDGIFDTDEELDAFLAHVAEMRHADLA
jgi:hypothetical protein